MSRIVVLIGVAFASAGCFSATIHLAEAPVASRSPVVDGSFHFNLLDLIEISDPIDLNAACAGRQPLAIEEGLGPLGALFNLVVGNTIPIVTAMNSSVICEAP